MSKFNRAPEWARTPEFRALQKIWYKKLKDSGFHDIETINSIQKNYINPQVPGNKVFVIKENTLFGELYGLYFEECLSRYHSSKISDPLDNHIFFQHAMGVSNEEIAQNLTGFGFPQKSRSTISRRLDKLRAAAGLPLVEFNSKLG